MSLPSMADRQLLLAAANRLAEITSPVADESWFDADPGSLAWALQDRYVTMTGNHKIAWDHAKFIAHMTPDIATVLGVWLHAVANNDNATYRGTAVTLATYVMETGFEAWDDWSEQYPKVKP